MRALQSCLRCNFGRFGYMFPRARRFSPAGMQPQAYKKEHRRLELPVYLYVVRVCACVLVGLVLMLHRGRAYDEGLQETTCLGILNKAIQKRFTAVCGFFLKRWAAESRLSNRTDLSRKAARR